MTSIPSAAPPIGGARATETPALIETLPGELNRILDGARAVHAATLADLVLIPTRPVIFDLRAILGTLDVVKGVARRSLIILNACPPARGVGEAFVVTDARRALAAFGVPVASVAITNRTAFHTAALAGLAVIEAEPDGKAAKEMRALWRLLEKELRNGKAHTRGRAGEESAAATGGRRVSAG